MWSAGSRSVKKSTRNINRTHVGRLKINMNSSFMLDIIGCHVGSPDAQKFHPISADVDSICSRPEVPSKECVRLAMGGSSWLSIMFRSKSGLLYKPLNLWPDKTTEKELPPIARNQRPKTCLKPSIKKKKNWPFKAQLETPTFTEVVSPTATVTTCRQDAIAPWWSSTNSWGYTARPEVVVGQWACLLPWDP